MSITYDFKAFFIAKKALVILITVWLLPSNASYRAGIFQGWEFAHRFSERITRFFPKMSEWAIRSKKKSDSLICSFLVSNLMRFAHDRPFPLRDLSESLMFSHFWWATWASCSHRSFPLSDLSDLLTVSHLSWVIWLNRSQSLIWFERNERMSKWSMSELANSQPWNYLCNIIDSAEIKFTMSLTVWR